jgi:DNA invertase Pin-like site-specific DNA recombinase
MQIRIVTWRAVSTDDQAERESLHLQARMNREHAARWNGLIIDELEIPGISRFVLYEDACQTIEAYAKLEALLNREAFDILMCYDVTRLGRTSQIIATVAAKCERANVRIYETTSPPPSLDALAPNADSRLLMLIKGFQSENEVRKIGERSVFGRRAQVEKNGHHAGGPRPTGFKAVYNDQGKPHTEFDERWRSAIELFYRLYREQRMSMSDIYQELNARGIPKPDSSELWDHEDMRVILRNRWAYAGFTTWGGTILPRDKRLKARAEWEAIISESTAEWVESEIRQRVKAPRSTRPPYRYSMVGRCDLCGATLVGQRSKRSTGQMIPYYRCVSGCRKTYVFESVVDQKMYETITALVDEALLDSLVGETPTEYTSLQREIHETEQRIESVKKERTKLTQAFMRELIALEEYEPLMSELKQRADNLADLLRSLEAQFAETPSAEERRLRLEEIRDLGLAYLTTPDIPAACAFFRDHLTYYAANGQVKRVQLFD